MCCRATQRDFQSSTACCWASAPMAMLPRCSPTQRRLQPPVRHPSSPCLCLSSFFCPFLLCCPGTSLLMCCMSLFQQPLHRGPVKSAVCELVRAICHMDRRLHPDDPFSFAAVPAAEGWVLPVSNSPKPPSERITLTMPLLNAAKNVAVVALGKVGLGHGSWAVSKQYGWHICRRRRALSAGPGGVPIRSTPTKTAVAGRGVVARRTPCSCWWLEPSHHHHPIRSLPCIIVPACIAVPLQGKAEVVQRALEVQSLPGALPVQLVQPAAGQLTWVLDQGSAGALRVADWELGSKKFPRSENPPKPAA